MARNTPIPLQILQVTADKLKTLVLARGEVAYDIDNKRLVVGDGVTPGGIVPQMAGDFLPLTGGTLTNALTIDMDGYQDIHIKRPSIDSKVAPDSDKNESIQFEDKDGVVLGAVGLTRKTSGGNDTVLSSYVYSDTGELLKQNTLLVRTQEDGTGYVLVPTPPESVTDNRAVQTKESVQRDFLAKTGGEMTGPVRFITSVDALDTIESNVSITAMDFRDMEGFVLGGCGGDILPDNHSWVGIYGHVLDNSNNWPSVRVNMAPGGVAYATAPHPRTNNYGNDIVTTKHFIDNSSPLISGGVYVGDVTGASDTADLWQGRGLTPEKPFKTFGGAWEWLNRHSNNNQVAINLLTDLEWNPAYPWFMTQTLNTLVIQSYPTTDRKKLILPKGAKVLSGFVEMNNLEINFPANGNHEGLWSQGSYRGSSPTLKVNNCVLSGQADVIFNALGNGTIFVSSLSGTVTGKKYSATACSRISGVATIPGTMEGTKDDSAVVA